MEVSNLSGLDPAIGEIMTYGKEPSHSGGESVNGSNSTFTGRGDGLHKYRKAEQATSVSTNPPFQSDGGQILFFCRSHKGWFFIEQLRTPQFKRTEQGAQRYKAGQDSQQP